jgi:hypothetical protein
MALARAPNPKAALEKERGEAKGRMRRGRANVRPAGATPEPTCDEDRVRYAVPQAKALRETLVAIKDHNRRARAVRVINTILDDVRKDAAERVRRGEARAA